MKTVTPKPTASTPTPTATKAAVQTTAAAFQRVQPEELTEKRRKAYPYLF